MASVLRGSLLITTCRKYRPCLYRHATGQRATFSASATTRGNEFDDIFPNLRRSTNLSQEDYAKIEEYVKKDLADVENTADEDRPTLRQVLKKYESDDPNEPVDGDSETLNQFWEDAYSSYGVKKVDAPEKRKKLKQTFMNMGEAEPWEDDGMLPDDDDDITSMGHGELEQHREMRHYARLAAWEMPLLYNLRRPYKPPTSEMPLRFRYTTYMGEQHPAENKVVLEFCPLDIPDLTEVQQDKLKKLAGVRWNPETNIVKMSCESYETQAQNKRYLGDIFQSLLKEAKDETDTMEDIPLYTKHHRFKSIPQFPREWILTEERQKELQIHLKKQVEKDIQARISGQLIDGIDYINRSLNTVKPDEKNTVLTEVVGAGEGRGKRLAVKR